MKNKIFSLIMALAMALPIAAQDLRSTYFMETSNYRHEMNPALLDAPYITMPLLLGNLNLGLSGNLGLKNFVYKMDPSWQGYGVDGRQLTTFMHPSVNAASFLGDLKDKNRLLLDFKYQLAGVGFKAFGGMNVVELNMRLGLKASLPKSLFDFMKTAGEKSDYQITNLGLRSESYMELGLGHSHKIGEKLTVGGKVKFLVGVSYADFNVEKLNLHLNEDYWNVDGKIHVSAALMKSTLEYESPDKNYVDANGNVTNRRRISGIDDVKFGLSGFGMALDLGAVYQLNSDLKVSLGITDLGFVGWKNAYQASSAGTWKFDGFENDVYCGGTDTGNNKIEDQLDAIGDDLEQIFSVYEDEEAQKTDSRALAATLNLGAEYTLPAYRKLHFGFLYSGRYAGKYTQQQGMLVATVRPVKWFEASWNVAAGTTGITSGLVLDFHARHFNAFVGTDRFFGKLSKQFIPLNRTNANIALGFSFPM